MPFNVGPIELIIVLVIALLVVGPRRLPEMGNAVGRTIREFRKASTDITDAATLDAEPKAAAGATSATAAPAATTTTPTSGNTTAAPDATPAPDPAPAPEAAPAPDPAPAPEAAPAPEPAPATAASDSKPDDA